MFQLKVDAVYLTAIVDNLGITANLPKWGLTKQYGTPSVTLFS